MARVRVYVGAGPADLACLRSAGLTTGIAMAVPAGASEEREHEAWLMTAEAAGAVAAQQGRRRVIVSADVDQGALDPLISDRPGLVSFAPPLRLKDVVSFHIDERAGSGLTDLLWFDVTEIDDVEALQVAP